MSTVHPEVSGAPETAERLAVPLEALGLTESAATDILGRIRKLAEMRPRTIAAAAVLNAASDEEWRDYNEWASKPDRDQALSVQFAAIDDASHKRGAVADTLSVIDQQGRGVVGRLCAAMEPGRYTIGSGAYEYFQDATGDGYLARFDNMDEEGFDGPRVILGRDWLPSDLMTETTRLSRPEDFIPLLQDVLSDEG